MINDDNFLSGLVEEDKQTAQGLARLCRSMIKTDKDNMLIVDYLGKGFEAVRLRMDHNLLKTGYDLGIQFIEKECNKWEKQKDQEGQKIFERYCLLRNYFLENENSFRIRKEDKIIYEI